MDDQKFPETEDPVELKRSQRKILDALKGKLKYSIEVKEPKPPTYMDELFAVEKMKGVKDFNHDELDPKTGNPMGVFNVFGGNCTQDKDGLYCIRLPADAPHAKLQSRLVHAALKSFRDNKVQGLQRGTDTQTGDRLVNFTIEPQHFDHVSERFAGIVKEWQSEMASGTHEVFERAEKALEGKTGVNQVLPVVYQLNGTPKFGARLITQDRTLSAQIERGPYEFMKDIVATNPNAPASEHATQYDAVPGKRAQLLEAIAPNVVDRVYYGRRRETTQAVEDIAEVTDRSRRGHMPRLTGSSDEMPRPIGRT